MPPKVRDTYRKITPARAGDLGVNDGWLAAELEATTGRVCTPDGFARFLRPRSADRYREAFALGRELHAEGEPYPNA